MGRGRIAANGRTCAHGAALMKTIRVLLVDDNGEFLTILREFVAGDPRMQIVGDARSGCQAINQVGRLCPDVVVMDISMPEMNGLEATRRIKEQQAAPRIIILTMHDESCYREAATAIGADGFLSKSRFYRELLPMIDRLYSVHTEPIDRQ
jgi:DNA-binding NarL/FixJ family response regulator